MVLDSGSDITIINSKLIIDDQLIGQTVTIHTVDDRPIHFLLARVCLHVGYSIDHVVAVSHTIKGDALLGMDLENFRDLLRLGMCQEMEKALMYFSLKRHKLYVNVIALESAIINSITRQPSMAIRETTFRTWEGSRTQSKEV